MNKKFYLGLFAAGMLLATSCSNDELTQVQSGEYADVSISLGVEEVAGSRAISDGTGADELYYAVFNSTGQRISTIAQVHKTGVKFPTIETITLAKGQTYKVAFWAQDDDCAAYTVSDDMNVTVNYVGINNDETRDAFFKTVEFTVNGSTSLDVELKRPFAQINVGVETTDWDAAVASGVEIKESNVTIENAATSINLVTGKVDGSEKVNYTTSAIPAEPLKANNSTYNWLSMSYILVNDASETGDAEATLTSLNYTFTPKSGNAITFSEGLNNVPVRRNWRTNILGKILTGDITFNISIDPIYDGDINYPEGSAQELEFAATFGGTYTLTEGLTLPTLGVGGDFIFNIEEDVTLTSGSASAYGIRVYNGTTIINNEGTIDSKGGGIGVVGGASVIYNSGDLSVDTESTSGRYLFYLEGEGSTVTINGGNFSWDPKDNQKRAYICAMDGTTAYVKGGTFGKASTRSGYSEGIKTEGTGKVIITGGTFGFDPTKWVADGYKVVKSGENWIVVANDVTVATTSAEVVAAFANGGNVVLNDDITLDERLNVAEGKEVNLDLNGKTIKLEGTSADPAFYTYKGSTLTITGNGTVEINDPSVSLMFPGGDVVIENGTFLRNVPAGTPANQVGAFFVGAKVSPWGSQTVTIKGGYFDGGYYNADAADVDDILAGTKTLTETADDIAKRGNSKDANKVRVAIKQNVQLLLNLSYNLFKVYGGTFVGANPAWGDEGCMLPTNPNYLRPWSYYQGALLDGQTFNENGLEIPAGYEITKGATADGRPTYTVSYNK